MREVEGDFVITVKVVGEFRPGGKSTNPKTVPFNGAGILVWSDPDNYIRLERAAVNRRGKINTYVNFEEFEGGSQRRRPQRGDEGGRLLGAHGAQRQPHPRQHLLRRQDLERTQTDPDRLADEAQSRRVRDQFEQPAVFGDFEEFVFKGKEKKGL